MSYPPLQLAEAFIQAGELEDAMAALDQHLSEHPQDTEVKRLRVQVLMRLGDVSHLSAALSELESLDQTALDNYTRSVLYERLSPTDLTPALEAAGEASKQAEDEGLRTRSIGRVIGLLRKRGDYQDALALALDEDWVQLAADIALQMNNPQVAVASYSKALERVGRLDDVTSPEIADNIRARILLKRAGSYRQLGGDSLADADYQAAGKVIPDDPMIPFNRALIAHRRGDPTATIALLSAAYDLSNVMLRQIMTAEIAEDTALMQLWTGIIGES